MTLATLTHVLYLVAAALFIFGLKLLGSPKSARNGNLLSAGGMLLAVVVTLLDRQIVSFTLILAGLLVGAAIGAYLARTVQMTAMPQMVAIFNGFGGGASALVAIVELLFIVQLSAPSSHAALTAAGSVLPIDTGIAIALGVFIGMLTLSGSILAFLKLQGFASQPVLFAGQHAINLLLFLMSLGLMGALTIGAGSTLVVLLVLTVLSLVLGVTLVLPIGGADMPVVISLLNSYSGLAGSAAGFVVGNNILIIAGALVGAAGLILTQIMAKAMNRSLTNVAFGGFGAQAVDRSQIGQRPVHSVDPEEAAMVLAYAQSVVFVPGYGLAVAQAQRALKEVADLLEQRGSNVRYAIHPVAGRMPGHMNVLLAEADVPYDKLFDRDDINDDLANTDVAVIVGANDVVNPAAHEEGSAIYGMPILDVDRAQHVIVIKRSLSPGFAGIDNDLFYMDKTMMLFADAKEALTGLARAIKDVD